MLECMSPSDANSLGSLSEEAFTVILSKVSHQDLPAIIRPMWKLPNDFNCSWKGSGSVFFVFCFFGVPIILIIIINNNIWADYLAGWLWTNKFRSFLKVDLSKFCECYYFDNISGDWTILPGGEQGNRRHDWRGGHPEEPGIDCHVQPDYWKTKNFQLEEIV